MGIERGVVFLVIVGEYELDGEQYERGDDIQVGLDRRGQTDATLELKESTLERVVGRERVPFFFHLISRVEVVLVEERILKAGTALALVAAFHESLARDRYTLFN